ncbi:MAG: DUF1540 domain-containing protein [Oscillospiraceae bacterium]
MTKLNCNVCDCASNKENHCCRPSIDVEGTNACSCCETTCHSYEPNPSGATNSTSFSNVNSTLDVSCHAQTCVHNNSGKCKAGSISIAQGTNGTECASFQSKN